LIWSQVRIRAHQLSNLLYLLTYFKSRSEQAQRRNYHIRGGSAWSLVLFPFPQFGCVSPKIGLKFCYELAWRGGILPVSRWSYVIYGNGDYLLRFQCVVVLNQSLERVRVRARGQYVFLVIVAVMLRGDEMVWVLEVLIVW